MEQEMCIQFTVFLCNLNSSPCICYNAVSNYGITDGFFPWHPCPCCSWRAAEAAQCRMGLHVWNLSPSQAWRQGSEASDGKREDKVLLKEMGIPALLLLQGSGMVLGKLLFMHKEGLDFPGPQGEG